MPGWNYFKGMFSLRKGCSPTYIKEEFFSPQCMAKPILKRTVVIPEFSTDTILKGVFDFPNAQLKLFLKGCLVLPNIAARPI